MLKIAMELKKPDARALDDILKGVLTRMQLSEETFRRYLERNGGLLRMIAQKKYYVKRKVVHEKVAERAPEKPRAEKPKVEPREQGEGEDPQGLEEAPPDGLKKRGQATFFEKK